MNDLSQLDKAGKTAEHAARWGFRKTSIKFDVKWVSQLFSAEIFVKMCMIIIVLLFLVITNIYRFNFESITE